MTTDADVIIAGAGPAGSLAAYELAIRGVSVLILEKSVFPRYKVCGAGLTHKILHEIPYDISPVLETQVNNIIFSKGFREVYQRSSDEPIMYCTGRDKLDEFFLHKAVEAGARVIHGAKVTGVAQEKDFVSAVTRAGTYHSGLLIGADGASGSLARLAGLRENIMPGLALEAEVAADPLTVRALSKTVFLDWGSFPGGYGWVFPKGDHFSIGVGGPASLAKWMMSYYHMLVEYLETGYWMRDDGGQQELKGIKILETMSLKFWPIPVRVKKSQFHKGRVLVAGDAAGLTDPLTGEGIYYAIRSGMMAARCCHEYLQSGVSSLGAYSDEVNNVLMKELLEANRIKHLFNTVPLTIHHFVRDNDRAWRAFSKILRGERGYTDVPGGFGRWKALWGTATCFSKLVSGYKEKQFVKHGFT